MHRTRSHLVLASALVCLTFATSVEAQGPVRPRPRDPAAGATGPQPGVMRRGGAPSGPDGVQRVPRGRRGNPAAMLLGLRGPLALTDEQVTRLEALAAVGAPQRSASDMLRVRADLMDAMQGDGNLNSARAALDKMSRLRNDAMIAGLKQRQESRAILTSDQRKALDNMRQTARERGGRGVRGGRGAQGRPVRGFDRVGRLGIPQSRGDNGRRRSVLPVPPPAGDQG